MSAAVLSERVEPTLVPVSLPNLVAVYGSLKQGFGNHRLLKNATFVSAGLLDGARMISLGAYPAIYLTGEDAKVSVELYEITEDQLDRLDNLEGYPSFYNRSIVAINTPSGSRHAWVYHFNIDKGFNSDSSLEPDSDGVYTWKGPTRSGGMFV